MKFVENVAEEKYKGFFEKCAYNHFLQAYEYGKVNKVQREQEPVYVGIEDSKGNLVAASLLLKRKTPLGMCYFYAPRGFLIDYSAKKTLSFFVSELKKFLKKENAIYLKIDPEIMYQEIDSNAQKIENGKNNYAIFNNLIELGFVHQGFNKLYEGNQPRYTFRIPVDIDIKEIEAKIDKSVMKKIRKSYSYDLVVEEGSDTKDFYKLMVEVADKNDFKAYKEEYYQTFYEEYSKSNKALILQIKLFPDELYAKKEKELLENNNIDIERVKKELELLKPYLNKYKNGLIVASQICAYTKDIMWTLFLGNNDLARELYCVNRMYYEVFLLAKKMGMKYVDLFGVVGDPNTTYKNLSGIHKYKANFGGEYIEFIGEFDLVNKPLWYKLMPLLLKIYRKIRKK